MGAALLWDSLLCPHAIMHLNHQLMHPKDRNRAACNTKGSVPTGASGSVPPGTEVLCPALTRGSAHPSTPTYSSLRHHSRGSGSTASAGRGLTGVSTCKLFTLLEGEQASRSLGDAKCPEGLWRDIAQSFEDMAPHGSGWHQTPAGAWTVEFELFHCWKEYSGKVQVSSKQY